MNDQAITATTAKKISDKDWLLCDENDILLEHFDSLFKLIKWLRRDAAPFSVQVVTELRCHQCQETIQGSPASSIGAHTFCCEQCDFEWCKEHI